MVARGITSFEEQVGHVLLEAGFVTEEQLEQGRQEATSKGAGLLDTMLDLGIVARETLVTVLSFQLRTPVVDLKNVHVDPEAVGLVPEELARERRILPVGFDSDGSLRIATLMPNDFQLSTHLSSVTGRQTKFALALSGDLDELINRTYATTTVQPAGPRPESAPPAAGLPAAALDVP